MELLTKARPWDGGLSPNLSPLFLQTLSLTLSVQRGFLSYLIFLSYPPAPGTRLLCLQAEGNKKLATFSLKCLTLSPWPADGVQISLHCPGGPSGSGSDPAPSLSPSLLTSPPTPFQTAPGLGTPCSLSCNVSPSLSPCSFSFW